jgi:hypothetical protein
MGVHIAAEYEQKSGELIAIYNYEELFTPSFTTEKMPFSAIEPSGLWVRSYNRYLSHKFNSDWQETDPS